MSIAFQGAAPRLRNPRAASTTILGKPRHASKAVPLVDEHGQKIVHDANGNRVRDPGEVEADGRFGAGLGAPDAAGRPSRNTRPVSSEELGAEPQRYWCRGDVVRLEADMRGRVADV